MSATALPTAKVMTKVRGVQLGGVTPRCCGEDGCPGTTCWVWNDSAPVNCIPRSGLSLVRIRHLFVITHDLLDGRVGVDVVPEPLPGPAGWRIVQVRPG